MSTKWTEILSPILGKDEMEKLSFSLTLTAADPDKFYCGLFKEQAKVEYDKAMQDDEFVRKTCCQHDKEHNSCPA